MTTNNDTASIFKASANQYPVPIRILEELNWNEVTHLSISCNGYPFLSLTIFPLNILTICVW